MTPSVTVARLYFFKFQRFRGQMAHGVAKWRAPYGAPDSSRCLAYKYGRPWHTTVSGMMLRGSTLNDSGSPAIIWLRRFALDAAFTIAEIGLKGT